MVKIAHKGKNFKIELPARVEHNGKIYWIKEATKKSGIYMNDVEPKMEMLIKENEFTSISK